MLYEEAKVYLDHVSKYGSVLGLNSIRCLLGELGNPQNDLEFIHIAGTNGKGSILASISCILRKAGYRVGRYSSPTVMGYMERFQINGRWMPEDELALFVSAVKAAAKRVEEKYGFVSTVFEIETAIAFLYFKKHACDYVVLETGLGGLEDATNVIENTKLCVFASISKDHLGVLGNTLEEIAKNKAGIIKLGAKVVTAHQEKAVLAVLQKKATKCGCEIRKASPHQAIVLEESLEGQRFSYGSYIDLKLQLLGRHQIDNAVTVLEAVEVLRECGVKISQQDVKEGLADVTWPGRFQVLKKEPLVIVDGAHNRDAALRLAENIRCYLPGRKITGIMGVFQDKEFEAMIDAVAPYFEKVYTVDLKDKERSLAKETLCSHLKAAGVCAEAALSIPQALSLAEQHTEKEDVVLVFGSLSYLGEVIRECTTNRKDEMS